MHNRPILAHVESNTLQNAVRPTQCKTDLERVQSAILRRCTWYEASLLSWEISNRHEVSKPARDKHVKVEHRAWVVRAWITCVGRRCRREMRSSRASVSSCPPSRRATTPTRPSPTLPHSTPAQGAVQMRSPMHSHSLSPSLLYA